MFVNRDSWDTEERDCNVVARGANLRALKRRLGLDLPLKPLADALFFIASCGAPAGLFGSTPPSPLFSAIL